MTGQELSPLLKQAICEIAELAAAVASFDDQLAQARKIAEAYGKLVFSTYSKLNALCEIEYPDPPFESGGKRDPYYRLSDRSDPQPIFCPTRGERGIDKYTIFLLMKINPERRLDNSGNCILDIQYSFYGDPQARISINTIENLLHSFPSIIRSMMFLKERMKASGEDLQATWEQLRQVGLTQ